MLLFYFGFGAKTSGKSLSCVWHRIPEFNIVVNWIQTKLKIHNWCKLGITNRPAPICLIQHHPIWAWAIFTDSMCCKYVFSMSYERPDSVHSTPCMVANIKILKNTTIDNFKPQKAKIPNCFIFRSYSPKFSTFVYPLHIVGNR